MRIELEDGITVCLSPAKMKEIISAHVDLSVFGKKAGISKKQPKKYKSKKKTTKAVFTEKDINFIVKNFGKMKRREIADILGKKPRQISDKVTALREQGIYIKRKYTKRK